MPMFNWFRPAQLQHTHPLIGRVAKLMGFKQPDMASTTEQGASATASPSTFQFQLLTQRYDRISIIGDVRRLLLDDPRLAKANRKFAREAVRKGVTVVCQPADNAAQSVADQAQAIIDTLNTAAKINDKLFGWAQMLLAEGDLFLQLVAMGGEVINVKRMPADSIERNTDETDSFPDLNNAFLQFDTVTQTTCAEFAFWQMVHIRWNHIDGERYGTSEYIQIRPAARMLSLVEQSQVIRRLTRGPQRRIHNVGTAEHPAPETGRGSVQEYRERNALINKPGDAFDPMRQVMDIYGNGLVSVTTLPGDPQIHEIADIKHYQDVFMAGTGVPKALIGVDAESINRDVLKDQHEEWLKETVALSDSLAQALTQVYHIALLMAGINPDSVSINLRFSESNMETASDRVDRVLKLRQATIGSGRNAVPDPLITKQTALQMLADDLSIADPGAEIEAIEAELVEFGIERTPGQDGGVTQPEDETPAPPAADFATRLKARGS